MAENIKYLVDIVFNDRMMSLSNVQNWGDLIPYYIIKELSKSDKLKADDVFNVRFPYNKYKIYSTGSVMSFTNVDSIVWGTGCIMNHSIGGTPKKIYSVRGPLTRKQLQLRNIDCPEIYGDPALLYPLIYNPKIDKKYKLGIIPHYIEFQSEKDIQVLRNLERQGVKIINICAGKEGFIDELLEVEKVVSSCLHGMIAADAYGIPNARVNISNKLTGGHFKFQDYCISINRKTDYGYQLNNNTKIKEIENLDFNAEITFDGNEYLKSAPWISNEFNLF